MSAIMGSRIENEFVPYQQALALKKLGFNNYCLTCYLNGILQTDPSEIFWFQHSYRSHSKQEFVSAPTFSQSFRWFREKYGLDSSIALVANGYGFYIHKNRNYTNRGESYGVNITYEEAELACLNKLIEIVKL